MMRKNTQLTGRSGKESAVTNAIKQQEPLAFLYQYGVIYFWLHVLAATLLCALSWAKVVSNTLALSNWYFTVILLAAVCWVLRNRLANDQSDSESLMRYRIINTLLCGLWGASGLFLFDGALMTQVIHLCLLLIIALSVWPMSIISSREFYIQLAILLAPITLTFAVQQNLKTNLLCLVIVAFVGITALLTHLFSRILSSLVTQQQALLKQVQFDPVTQLVSNGHFNQVLKTEWQRSAREQKPLSLIMLEVDDFPAIKEALGNKAFNQYLLEITRCLKSVVRRSADTLAHYDGADFVALLPGTTLDETKHLAERLQHKLAQAALSNPLAVDPAPITFTLGVSSCVPTLRFAAERTVTGSHAPVAYPAMLLRCAEQALQKKNNDRQQLGHLTYRQDTSNENNSYWDQSAEILQGGWQPVV